MKKIINIKEYKNKKEKAKKAEDISYGLDDELKEILKELREEELNKIIKGGGN